jgi:hypothetical protein
MTKKVRHSVGCTIRKQERDDTHRKKIITMQQQSSEKTAING